MRTGGTQCAVGHVRHLFCGFNCGSSLTCRYDFSLCTAHLSLRLVSAWFWVARSISRWRSLNGLLRGIRTTPVNRFDNWRKTWLWRTVLHFLPVLLILRCCFTSIRRNFSGNATAMGYTKLLPRKNELFEGCELAWDQLQRVLRAFPVL